MNDMGEKFEWVEFITASDEVITVILAIETGGGAVKEDEQWRILTASDLEALLDVLMDDQNWEV